MKIGILTYHRVVNDGSILQAYCLYKLIQSLYPKANIEIIDYRPLRGEVKEHRQILSRQLPWIQIRHWQKLRNTHQILKDHCVLSTHSCTTDTTEKAHKFVQSQEYDAIFVGSDTVWEARLSAFVPPFPNIYFLPDLTNIKKISFAASADPILPEYTQNNERANKIKKAIDDFDFISVRDEATQNYLTDLGISPKRVHFMPDPTLLWDFSSLVEKPKAKSIKHKPLAGISIGISNSRVKVLIAEQLQKNGYDILYLSKAEQVESALACQVRTVGQRLGVHATLDLLITDRFHGSIFTLLQAQSPVIFVETAAKWPNPNSKGRDLFRRLGIESMVWRYEEAVDPELVKQYLQIWRELSPHILAQVSALRESAQYTLDLIKQEIGK